MLAPFVLRNLSPRVERPGGFFLRHLDLAFIMQAPILAHLAGLGHLAHGLKGAAFLPAGALAIIIFFPFIMGVLQLAFPSPQAFIDSTVGVFGSFFTGQLLFHTGHPGTE
jgi:hypothetical protein